jgi:hypothetical protein
MVRPQPIDSLPDTRMSGIAEILAAGLMRVLTRKSSGQGAVSGESSLDFSAKESGHPTPIGVSDA